MLEWSSCLVSPRVISRITVHVRSHRYRRPKHNSITGTTKYRSSNESLLKTLYRNTIFTHVCIPSSTINASYMYVICNCVYHIVVSKQSEIFIENVAWRSAYLIFINYATNTRLVHNFDVLYGWTTCTFYTNYMYSLLVYVVFSYGQMLTNPK